MYFMQIIEFGMAPECRKGGIESYLINYYREFIKLNINCDFIAFSGYEMSYENEILQKGSKIYKISERNSNVIQSLYDAVKLFWNIRNEYDVIVLNMGGAPQYAIFLALAYCAGISKRIVHAHGACAENSRDGVRCVIDFIDKMIVKVFATDYWACSLSAGKYLFPNKNCNIIKNAIDIDRYRYNADVRKKVRKELEISDNCILIGMVGRFVQIKNFRFMLPVLCKLLKNKANVKLIVVGDYTAADCKICAEDFLGEMKRRNLDDYIIMYGKCDCVADMYQAMDVFVVPSLLEGLSFVTIEAQTSGLPCLVSTGVPQEAIVCKNMTERISLDEEPHVWAETILRLYYEHAKERHDNGEFVRKAGYDIKIEAKKIKVELSSDILSCKKNTQNSIDVLHF